MLPTIQCYFTPRRHLKWDTFFNPYYSRPEEEIRRNSVKFSAVYLWRHALTHNNNNNWLKKLKLKPGFPWQNHRSKKKGCFHQQIGLAFKEDTSFFFNYLPECCNPSEDIQQSCWQTLLMTCRKYIQWHISYLSSITNDWVWSLRRTLVNCYIRNTRTAETWTHRKVDQKYLGKFCN